MVMALDIVLPLVNKFIVQLQCLEVFIYIDSFPSFLQTFRICETIYKQLISQCIS